MTAFSTCAFPGCYMQIPYEPKTDKRRDRYCVCHMKVIGNRLGNKCTDNDLVIEVKETREDNPGYMKFLQEYVR